VEEAKEAHTHYLLQANQPAKQGFTVLEACRWTIVATCVAVGLLWRAADTPAAPGVPLPSLDEVVDSKQDLWGEAAMRQPNGASYEFFERLLPPLRYVNADFHYYPIILGAPRATTKARLISNGSGINRRANTRAWHEVGSPVLFRVGPDEFLFGTTPERTSEPELADGYLPIVEIRYRHPSPMQAAGDVPVNQQPVAAVPEVYRLEAFASTDPALAESAVVFARFSLAAGTRGFVTVQVEGKSPLKFAKGRVLNDQGEVLAYFDQRWQWERGSAHARLAPGEEVFLAVPSRVLENPDGLSVTADAYRQQRRQCADTWNEILGRAMSVETPEPRVNQAWRNLLIQNFEMRHGDRIHYSAGNQYDKLYEAEGSDAALAMMAWGFDEEMRQMIVPLLDFTRKGLEYHQAGFKLNDVCRLYWQTRDAAFVESLRPRWEKELKRILDGRSGPYSLFPKEQYCGDIATPVHSLSASAKAWRAVRDLAAVLGEMGQAAEAERLTREAAEFRKNLLAAIARSAHHETEPPFIPIALLSDEAVHDPITHVRVGSYWNLVINYVIGSGIFPPGSPQETWIPRYLQQHGGLCMGMTRSGAGSYTFWNGEHRTNPLYGTRYVIDALRRDDPQRAVVSFYGMLAHGFTRNTLVGGEGCALQPADPHGRYLYCPPNSAANGHFLSMLRNLLVQDFDLDDDGRPDTLRLCYATPRRWLEDGKTIRVEKAPTAFGAVSVVLRSKLSQGEVQAEVDPPQRNRPSRTLLRVRLPEGWRVVSARLGKTALRVDPQGTVDISGLNAWASIRFEVARQ
jgi:hypothetical protein